MLEIHHLIKEIGELRKSLAGLLTKHDLQELLKPMATKADLDAVIAALPAKIQTAVDKAIQPIIDAINAKTGDIDLQPEIDQLNAVGDTVGAGVAADITPKTP